ncbi:MAG: beta-propeller fold lactonase family protein [Terracidiphilus sp.]|jgi:6-phosphogluconolactonase (cycloisomerase 2 family)
MKFTKFGKALLMSALSAGVVLSFTSCNQSYTVAYLYVTGTATAQSSGEGIITGIQIDHNTGKMSAVRGTPVSSGGANPVRAVLLETSRFLYVLNRGATASGSADCTTADPCKNSNITLFTVGGNGVLTAQQTFFTQGINPFRLIADTSGSHLYVLDHDAPDSAVYSGVTPTAANPNSCMLALGNSATSCGDITAFSVNQNTGRLQLIVNAPVTAANGSALLYFPVPANPVDFAQAAASVLTLSGTPATSYPYTGGTSVFPYSYNAVNGQLTINQNSSQPLGITQGTAIVYASGVVYVLDNEPITVNFNDVVTTSSSQILPFTVGSNGALAAEPGGIIPDDPTLSNPIYLIVESKGKFVYVANQGNNTQGANAQSGIAGYFITTSPAYELSFIPDEPFGSGAGPQCLVEDPSDQFIYSADFNDSSVSGRVVDPNSGVLNNLRVTNTYALQGPATWCLVDGRTN